VLDIGGNSTSGAWMQSTDQSGLSTNYPLLLNPNGGNVAVGTTTAAYALHVSNPTAPYVALDSAGAASRRVWSLQNRPDVSGKLWIRDETASQTRMEIDTSGNIRMNAYGAGTITSDASGNLTSVPTGNIFTMTISSTVSNTTAETNMVSAGQPVIAGTVTIQSNFWTVGRSIEIKGTGFYSSSPTAPGNFHLKIKIGSTVVLSTSSVPYVVNQSSQVFSFWTTLTCGVTGAGGSVIGQTVFGVYDNTNGFRALPSIVNLLPVSVDLSAARDISFTWQDTVASINNSKTLTNFSISSE